MTPRDAYIALNMMDGMGPVRVRNLIAAVGSAEAIFEADEAALLTAEGVGREMAKRIMEQRGTVDPGGEEDKARRHHARIVSFVDEDYPKPLRNIYDPPLALYVRGTLEKRDRHSVAVVGTRTPTHYGSSVTDRLSYQLAKAGFTVISGLARGVDTAAHKAALKGDGRTIAVLGSAIDKLYPAENAELADRIAEHGAVISEYTMGRPSDRTTFPYRNRIVSGMSMGLLVVEASKESGAMITADMAAEQGKTIFAVPGRIDQPSSRGTHHLIKEGARLVEDVDDILQEFDALLPTEQKRSAKQNTKRPDVPLSEPEQAIVKALWKGNLDVDELTREAALPSAKVSAMLMGLEMKRVVRILPGRIVELVKELRDSRFET